MAASTYENALKRLLAHEGGYSNHPSDPGGPTKFGITIHDYRKYVKANATAADVKAMQLPEARAIYRDRYWNALRCDEFAAGLDYALFDYGVNSGVSRAAKVLQRILGFPDHGRMSDAVIAAAAKRETGDLIARLCDERLSFLKSLRTWPVFGTGWARRVAEVRRAALDMSRGVPCALPECTSDGRGAVVASKTARNAAAAGAVIAGGGLLNGAHQAGVGAPFVVAGLVGIGLAVIAGVLVRRWWRAHKQDRTAGAPLLSGALAPLRDRIKGWKTLVFGVLVTAASLAVNVLDALQAIDLTPLLPPSYAMKIIAVIGIATIVLRLATTGRIGQKDL